MGYREAFFWYPEDRRDDPDLRVRFIVANLALVLGRSPASQRGYCEVGARFFAEALAEGLMIEGRLSFQDRRFHRA